MQRCRTLCASLPHAALSYSLRFAVSCSVVVLSALRCPCSVVVLSALRCFMQRCRTLCASLPMQRSVSYSLRFAAHAALSYSLRFAAHAALSYSLRFAASCSVVFSALCCFLQRCRTLYLYFSLGFLLTNGCFAYCHVYCIIVLITSCISQHLYILMQFFSYMT